MSDRDQGNPMLELARRISPKVRVRPNLAGTSTAGGAGGTSPQWNVPQGTDGQVLVMVDIGGKLIPQFQDPPVPIGSGGQYRGLVFATDGAGGFVLVTATIGGQTWPVTALYDLE